MSCWSSHTLTGVCLTVVAWDPSLSDFKHLCIPLLKITLAFQNTGFSRNMYMVWLEQELYWHLGQDRSGLELQFILGRPLGHLHVRKKEGERQDFWNHTGVNKNQCSALESCSVPCVTHLNTHSLFYNVSALVTFSFPFLHCPWLPFAFPGLTYYLCFIQFVCDSSKAHVLSSSYSLKLERQ